MKKELCILVFLIGLVLFSFNVGAALETPLESGRCKIFDAPPWKMQTGNEVCAGKSQQYCTLTGVIKCDVKVGIFGCSDCVLCCDYEVNLRYEEKDYCTGPDTADLFVKETVTFPGGSWEDSCVRGEPNFVRKNFCNPVDAPGPGCTSSQKALITSANFPCPDNFPKCSNGKCVECTANSDCSSGKECSNNRCVDSSESPCNGRVCDSDCTKYCDERNEYCFEGECGECNIVDDGCSEGEECVEGECVEVEQPLPCPALCQTNNDCYTCCINNTHLLGEMTCNISNGKCIYEESYPCAEGSGCSYENGCCGTLNDDCCDNDVCYGGLGCDERGMCNEITCNNNTVDTYRCNPEDENSNQKCMEVGDNFEWVNASWCPLGCDDTNGKCIEPTGGMCSGSILEGCSRELGVPIREFAHTICCSTSRYQVCQSVGNSWMGMPPEGIPCPGNLTCDTSLGWQMMYSANDTPCEKPCKGTPCENPYYTCSNGNETYHHCVNEVCVADTPVVCSEGCDAAGKRCFQPIPCGSQSGASCCSTEPVCGSDLACNPDTELCESCGGNGELACITEPYCEEGLVLDDEGRCGDCNIFEIRWDSENEEDINTSVENQKVYAVVQGSNACRTTGFKLDSLRVYRKNSLLNWLDYEVDSAGDSGLEFNSKNQVKFEWTAEIGEGGIEPKYFFEIVYEGDKKEKSDDLLVLFCNGWYRKNSDLKKITSCSDYNNVDGNERVQCLADCNGIAVREAATLGTGMQNPVCGWVNEKCKLTYLNTEEEGGGGDNYNCIIEYDQLDECDSGDKFRTVVYRANELDSDGNVIEGSINCDAGCGTEVCTKPVLCPGIVKLPFFSWMSFILSLIIIWGVYFVKWR